MVASHICKSKSHKPSIISRTWQQTQGMLTCTYGAVFRAIYVAWILLVVAVADDPISRLYLAAIQQHKAGALDEVSSLLGSTYVTCDEQAMALYGAALRHDAKLSRSASAIAHNNYGGH